MSEWLKWLLIGVLSILFGIFALNHAVLTSMAVTAVVGAMFLVSGVIQAIVGFGETGMGNKILSVLIGVVMAILGFSFLANPLQGTVSLALLVTLFIFAGGVLRLFYAFSMRGTPFFWLMVVSGVLSVGLGVYILANPGVTVALLGILLGIELIFNGAGMIALGLWKRGRDKPAAASA